MLCCWVPQAAASQELLLQHCPLLGSQDLQLLQSSPPTVPGTSQPLTLQHLQSPVWWQHLPAALRDTWRRSAAVPGCPTADANSSSSDGGSSMAAVPGAAQRPQAAPAAAGAQSACSSSVSGGFLFTPHVVQLQQEGPVGLLARLVFWARWRLGEPIVVRGVKVCGVWRWVNAVVARDVLPWGHSACSLCCPVSLTYQQAVWQGGCAGLPETTTVLVLCSLS